MRNNIHDCRGELNDVKLRATPARIAIMKYFEREDKPADVQMLIDYLKKQKINADPATIFRIVNTFTEKGLTRQISLNEGKYRYELADKHDHHHLICEACGNIEDMTDCNIDDLEKDIKKKKGFNVKSHSLEFFGICKSCQH